MTAPDMLPCPFCGEGDPEVFTNTVSCVCGANGPRQDGPEFVCDSALALRQWNTRAPAMTPEVLALVELLREARADLETYVSADWTESLRVQHPSIQRKWERDMELCWRIDAALRGIGEVQSN